MNNRNGMAGGAGNTGSNVDQRTGSTIKERVHGIVEGGQERMHAFKDKVSDVKQQAMSRGNEYVDRVSELIRANPLKSIAIAFGIGYLGMRLFRR